MYDAPQTLVVPRLVDLYDNPQENVQETIGESAAVLRGWVAHAMFGELAKFKATLAKDPPVPMGTLDPYVPPTAGAASSPFTMPVPPAED